MDGQQTHGQMSTAVEKDYEILEQLGEGAFAMVYKARHKNSRDIVAIKQIKLGVKSWHEACRSTELQALRALRHPFIVRLRELIRSQYDGGLYYILEFIDSNLCHLVKAHPQGVEELRGADLSRQLFAGLAHMHQHNFFHRDIKPENILLESATMSVRIADFGQARSVRSPPPFTDYVGTRWYRAPECLLRDRAYSSPVDVWAAGLVLAELLRGSPVFCGTSSLDQLYKIFQVLGQPDHDWPEFTKLAEAMRFRVPEVSAVGVERVLPRASMEAVQIITDILVLSPRLRPMARKCMEHGFFARLPPQDLSGRPSFHDMAAKGAPAGVLLESPRRSMSRAFSVTSAASPGSPEMQHPMSGAAATQASEDRPDLELDAELDKILGETSDHPSTGYAAAGTAASGQGGVQTLVFNDEAQAVFQPHGLVEADVRELDAILNEQMPEGLQPGVDPLHQFEGSTDNLENLLTEGTV